MNYPQYRQAGLPTTSALMESLVKEISARVNGTEKFWAKWTSYRHPVQGEKGGVDKASAVFGGSAGKPCFAVERT